jgi:hypothetical protein
MADIDSLSKIVLGVLEELPNLDVYDSQVPDTPPQAYAVFYPGAGSIYPVRLADLGSRLDWDCRVVCCGRTPGQARRAADQTRAALSGRRLDGGLVLVEDRNLNAPMLRDDTVPSDIRFSHTLRFKTSAARS